MQLDIIKLTQSSMAHLFSRTVIDATIKNIQIPNLSETISLLSEWLDMYNSGTLQKKSEKEFEWVYSESLFGEILGYSSITNAVYTREKEPKNISNGQKPDIGLGYYSSESSITQAVVELKDAGTSLDRPQQRAGNLTPVQQAFKYKPLYNSKWVIVSNFFEIRLYTDTYQDFESFTLRELVDAKNDYENFRKFYSIFHASRLIAEGSESETERLLAKVRVEEEKISKIFYKEYKDLRLELMRDIWKHNPEVRNADVIEKAQRIIDRIVFICFCEDRGLIPQNELRHRVEQAKKFGFAPWEMLRKFFQSIDMGDTSMGIPDGYNGGLFRWDESIDTLKISDDIIEKFVALGWYDFSEDGGQLSVEILGHIFEQSISDIEEIRTQIENHGKVEEEKIIDTKVSKRKKDGIFYTPAYIVDYIVRNSLGRYLEEHEEALKVKYALKEDINEKNYRKREVEAYTEYQKILHDVKVLDPACGSWAFLVRVFDFLLEENKRVANILYIEWDQIRLWDDENYFREILRNNIYGVDLNAESVEITKLSLWLKSAQKGKKLVTLDANIKCGNSLIDDPSVAGDKAFDWESEFSHIFPQKVLKTFLITWVTHNSRVSERMIEFSEVIDYHRENNPNLWDGEPFFLDETMRDFLMEKLNEKIRQEHLRVLAKNILRDHVHIVIISTEDEIDEIVRKLKWYTSFCLGRELKLTVADEWRQNKIWAKGSSHTYLDTESHLQNAIEYTRLNHNKHEIPEINSKLQLAEICSLDEAYQPMYGWGFDVIVGNPPYVLSREDRFKKEKNFFSETYKLFHEKPNLYILFMEKGDSLLKKNWYLGFIIPNSWLWIDSWMKIRKHLLENTAIKKIINLKWESFAWVSVETSILLYSKCLSKNEDVIFFATVNWVTNFDTSLESVKKNQWLQNRNYIFDVQSNDIDSLILAKIATFEALDELYDVRVWLQAYEKWKWFPKQTEDDVKNHIFDFDYKYDETTYPYLWGSDVSRYSYSWSGQWLKHGKWLSQPKELEQFLQPRILIREITSKYPHVLNSMYFEEAFLNNKSIINILSTADFSLKFLLCVLNSQIISFYHSRLAVKGNRTLFPKVVVKDIQNYPIPNISLSEQQPFIDRADMMLTLNRELHEKSESFLANIMVRYGVGNTQLKNDIPNTQLKQGVERQSTGHDGNQRGHDDTQLKQGVDERRAMSNTRLQPSVWMKITRKLEKWWELDFAGFVKELKVKIWLEEQEELMSYFEKRARSRVG